MVERHVMLQFTALLPDQRQRQQQSQHADANFVLATPVSALPHTGGTFKHSNKNSHDRYFNKCNPV
jgi:hypothetical protein